MEPLQMRKKKEQDHVSISSIYMCQMNKWIFFSLRFFKNKKKRTVITASYFHIQKKWIIEIFAALKWFINIYKIFFFPGILFIFIFSQKKRSSLVIHWKITSLRYNIKERLFAIKPAPISATEAGKNCAAAQQPSLFVTISWRKLWALD